MSDKEISINWTTLSISIGAGLIALIFLNSLLAGQVDAKEIYNQNCIELTKDTTAYIENTSRNTKCITDNGAIKVVWNKQTKKYVKVND